MREAPSRHTHPGETVPSRSLAAAARVAATFPADELTARSARHLLSATFDRWGAEALRDDAMLVLSELVTNAVVHAGTSVEVVMVLHEHHIEVSVVDRHPGRTLPAPPAHVGLDREGGRGLALMVKLAAAWGVDYTDRTKRVWFRMPLFEGPVPSPRASADLPGPDSLHPGSEPVWAVATVRLRPDATVESLDAAAENLLGLTSEEASGRAWLSFCAEDDARTVLSAGAARRWQGTYHVVRPDGETTAVLARHVDLPAVEGSAATTACVLVDHRLRALIGDAGTPALTRRAEGPFGDMPDVLVRLELQEVMDRTVSWARETFDADGAYVLLVSDEEDELVLRAASGPQPLSDRRALPELATVPEIYDDLTTRSDADPWLSSTGARSAVTVPVLAGGRLAGSLALTCERTRAFPVSQVARLQRAVDEIALVVASGRLAEVERRRHGWLGYLAEASELLAGTLELDMTLALVAQLVTPRLAPWCAIYLADESDAGGQTELALAWHGNENHLEALRDMLTRVAAPEPNRRGIELWKPGVDAPEDLEGDVADVVPLVARGRILGSLVVGHRGPSGENRRQLRSLLADLAPRAALAVDNARVYAEQAATNAALQRSLLPPELPTLRGVEIGVVYEASGKGFQVGGDFYDVVRIPTPPGSSGEHFVFAVGDVCGKGAEAAAVTGLARTALRVLSRRHNDVPDVLCDLNAALLAEGDRGRFLTAIYGEGCNDDDGSVVLRLASAGHPAPMHLHADGTVTAVPGGGDLMGVFEEPEVTVTTVRLVAGESLVCFTDGVTERRRGDQMLGDEGVATVLRGTTHLSADALARRLGAAVRDYAPQPARDDVAILVLRATP